MNFSDSSKRLVGQKMFQIMAYANEFEKKGKSIIHLEIGDPDFDTPLNIKQAAIDSILKGETHYINSNGLLDLRLSACQVTKKSRGFEPSLNQVLVTPGANFQIYLAAACILNPGDEVIIPDPCFVSYESIINFLGCKIVNVPLLQENFFQLKPDDIKNKITKKTKMIIINSPNNPTGSVMKEEDIRSIANLCSKYGIFLISDEIYSRMIFKDTHTKFFSPSSIDYCREFTILINGFSKSYAMTGWRLGVVTAPERLISKMSLLLESLVSCVPIFTQRAGIEALNGSQTEIDIMVKEYRTRRDYMFLELNKIKGFNCVRPDGAFYIFPNIEKSGMSCEEISNFILEKVGVAVAPGNIFGKHGEGFIRLCYANSMKNLEEGIARIRSLFGLK